MSENVLEEITEENVEEAFRFLKEKNPQALLEALHYAVVYLNQHEDSPSIGVRRRAREKGMRVVRAETQFLNMLVGGDPYTYEGVEVMSTRKALAQAWAKEHQQGTWDGRYPPSLLNPYPDIFLAALEEDDDEEDE